jgi:ABC-type cobalamin transport system permease subunit
VGLNPFRQHHRSTADILMVAVALVVCVALVAWAFLG